MLEFVIKMFCSHSCKVPPREGEKIRLEAKGLFSGATVVRKRDWQPDVAIDGKLLLF
jgi:hypothetical protein